MQWEIDLGEVVHWNDDSLENEPIGFSIKYNTESDWVCNITTKSAYEETVYQSQELKIKVLDENKNFIEICDESYYLTDYQLSLLKQYSFYWREKVTEANSIVNGKCGLVMFYNKEIHSYSLADLQIELDKNNYKSGKLAITIYTENRLYDTRHIVHFYDFSFEYIDDNTDGLHHYKICDYHFLLTDEQEQKMCELYK